MSFGTPIQPAPSTPGNFAASGTTILDDYRNTLAGLQTLADRLNNTLRAVYLNWFFGTFLVNLYAGRGPATPDKQPDASWVVVGTLEDPTKVQAADMYNLTITQTGGPVCQVPAYSAPVVLATGLWFHAS